MIALPYTLHLGDSREVLKTIPDNSVDAIVTDPPYGLSKEPDMAEVLRHWLAGDDYTASGGGFMGKTWDSFVPGPAVWRECIRVLKPGGHLLAFFGSRTYDLGTLAIRLAGFEVRDQIMWLYGSGFPKSMDVSKAIDKAAGAERPVVGTVKRWGANASGGRGSQNGNDYQPSSPGAVKFDSVTGPATDAARQWEGWGTALKPAHEPICVARKPLSGTVTANVLAHGTGALNIDGCRIELNGDYKCKANGRPSQTGLGDNYDPAKANQPDMVGRWPANVIHDGSDEVLAAFPQASGAVAPVRGTEASSKTTNTFGEYAGRAPSDQRDGGGSASRFFYCAKASKADRGAENTHPTVKPTELMAYLCRLVTPPGGVVLDPFMGSGSTGKACMREEFRFIGIDLTPEYVEIARARIAHEHAKQTPVPAEPAPQMNLFGDTA